MKALKNGHTIQVNIAQGSKLQFDKESFDPLQFHFHRPSEEKIDGKPSAMVAHFVHDSATGKLAVIGVLLNESASYYSFEDSLNTPPSSEGVTFYILKSPVTMAMLQVDAFPYKVNARPVQPLNGRTVVAN